MQSPSPKPQTPNLEIVQIQGRYPYRPKPLHSENIRHQVSVDEDGYLRIRIDDVANGEAWLEITARFEITERPYSRHDQR